jgi:osmoprotectant transport system ATP-binding protein
VRRSGRSDRDLSGAAACRRLAPGFEDPMIQLENVTRTFDGVVAVDRVSALFESGRTHVLLGSSGCGKSTILRLVLGVIAPDSGAVRVDGEIVDASTGPGLSGRMGYVVQEGGLYPHLTAYRNVSLAAEARRWSEERIRARVGELATLVGFDDAVLRVYPDELSGGQRQRVSLMRALMLDPQILLLDEPLGSLDPLVRADLQQQLNEIFAAMGKTVILVTHDIREAAFFGHTVTLMTEGRVVQRGSFADLVRRPASEFVTAFLSAQKPTPEMQELH